jgi:hypothetical protein
MAGNWPSLTDREASVMKLFFAILTLFLVFLVTPVYAELYKFTDSTGKVHFVDDVHKIPQKFRKGAEVVETKPLNLSDVETTKEAFDYVHKTGSGESEIFGDKSLVWWEKQIKALRTKEANAKDAYEAMKDYVSVYEGGRRHARIFNDEEIKKYKEFKEKLPASEKRLETTANELSNLLKKARKAGVPKKVRGD